MRQLLSVIFSAWMIAYLFSCTENDKKGLLAKSDDATSDQINDLEK
ncbi:hypothetical protein [Sphingobacterium sp. IITKGP-BTPF85]|nr:hypothetical protein [Sphingobacterium sp. IITKGP-BTPF85]KKX49702.1 hypothetical protein L950_0214230 [Sphingobacterium sp. IITKGP-BTPF85]